MRRKGIVLLLVLALTLWALPTAALANDVTSSGEVGTTEASANFEEGTAEASASAASSEVPEPDQAVGERAVSAIPGGAYDTDPGPGPGVVDNGGGSNTTIENYSTAVWANPETPWTDPYARAQESVRDVTVTAPDGLPFDYLAKIVSEGVAIVGQWNPGDPIVNASFHAMGGALFDNEGDGNEGIIKFGEGVARAYSRDESEGGPWAYAAIWGLSIWDPNTSGYVNFADFNSDTNPPDDADLAAINALLKKSNLFMHHLVSAGVLVEDAATYASASLMAILYPYPPSGVYTGEYQLWLELATVESYTEFAPNGEGGEEEIILAWAKGKELYFEYTPPPKTEEQPKPTEPPPPTEPTPTVTAPQPEIQPVQPQPEVQPAPAPVAQPQAQPAAQPEAAEQLPVTGFNFSWLLLGVGLILTGLRLRRI